MAKKIIDEVLNKMIADGKPQREMARLFGVSDAAISKRIKRLHQTEPPESFKSLSPKEQKFVLANWRARAARQRHCRLMIAGVSSLQRPSGAVWPGTRIFPRRSMT